MCIEISGLGDGGEFSASSRARAPMLFIDLVFNRERSGVDRTLGPSSEIWAPKSWDRAAKLGILLGVSSSWRAIVLRVPSQRLAGPIARIAKLTFSLR